MIDGIGTDRFERIPKAMETGFGAQARHLSGGGQALGIHVDECD